MSKFKSAATYQGFRTAYRAAAGERYCELQERYSLYIVTQRAYGATVGPSFGEWLVMQAAEHPDDLFWQNIACVIAEYT